MKSAILYICFAALSLSFTGCADTDKYTSVDGAMLGTSFHVSGDVKECTAKELYNAIMAVDTEMKASMSIFDENSLLSRINRNQTDSLDKHITYNIKLAEQISRMSDGVYDITIEPLVSVLGFAGKDPQQNPNIDSILQFVGYDMISITNGRIVKTDPRVKIDLNSIAKGYTVDMVAEVMEQYGAENYIVDIGGEIRCKGVNAQAGKWRIGIDAPFDGNMSPGQYMQQRIELSEGGLATSGNYRRFYIDENGKKVAHTINPRTGQSAVSRLLSVTVVADNCAKADAMGTMFMALGADDAIALAETIKDIKVYFILAGEGDRYETYCSPQMEKMLMKN